MNKKRKSKELEENEAIYYYYLFAFAFFIFASVDTAVRQLERKPIVDGTGDTVLAEG